MLPPQAILSARAMAPIPVPLGILGSGVAIDYPGQGPATSVEFVAWDGLGREAANSEKRGLNVELPADGDALLEPSTVGLRAGGRRFVWIAAESLPGDLGGVFPPRTDALIWIVAR